MRNATRHNTTRQDRDIRCFPNLLILLFYPLWIILLCFSLNTFLSSLDPLTIPSQARIERAHIHLNPKPFPNHHHPPSPLFSSINCSSCVVSPTHQSVRLQKSLKLIPSSEAAFAGIHGRRSFILAKLDGHLILD